MLLAVTMFDESAKNLTINVRTDSKMVMDAWKKYESGKMTEKERRTHPLRLYLMAMKAKLHEPNRTVKIEHVRAHWAADDQTLPHSILVYFGLMLLLFVFALAMYKLFEPLLFSCCLL